MERSTWKLTIVTSAVCCALVVPAILGTGMGGDSVEAALPGCTYTCQTNSSGQQECWGTSGDCLGEYCIIYQIGGQHYMECNGGGGGGGSLGGSICDDYPNMAGCGGEPDYCTDDPDSWDSFC